MSGIIQTIGEEPVVVDAEPVSVAVEEVVVQKEEPVVVEEVVEPVVRRAVRIRDMIDCKNIHDEKQPVLNGTVIGITNMPGSTEIKLLLTLTRGIAFIACSIEDWTKMSEGAGAINKADLDTSVRFLKEGGCDYVVLSQKKFGGATGVSAIDALNKLWSKCSKTRISQRQIVF